ncbi:MAG: AAA family ATPase [Mycobacteriaceae bacterium]
MARYTEQPRGAIDATVDLWRQRCLLGDDSLTHDEAPETWSLERLEDLNRRFNDNPLLGSEAGGTFSTKWQKQLQDCEPTTRLLAAEILLVHFLFASSVTKKGKLALLDETLDGSGYALDPDQTYGRALGQGIGHPGIGFNTRRDVQVGYLIDFALRLKRLSSQEREGLLADAWKLRDFADDTQQPVREMRHVLLHLLRPDDFERISSGTHKREIAIAFAGLLGEDAPEDVDERLLAIRSRLQALMPAGNTTDRQIDFYHAPLHGVWESNAQGDGDGAGDLEALMWKKQIVFYGPPGTSKTYQARQLAETLIRREALARWKPEHYFEHLQDVESLVKSNIHTVQLHPAFGYPEFIRGLHLDGEQTVYRPGLLLGVIDQAATQQVPPGLPPLPVVLILDEMNRTDVSAMLGEAFSLLESGQRGRTITLPGANGHDGPATLTIPEDLFLIGTMNEIDQSVETLDFALRRRFLWRECPFERETLLEIITSRWASDVKKFRIDDAWEQLSLFADRADALNRAIADSAELGRAYQIGHTYFADITFFLGTWLHGRKTRPPNGTYLWTSQNKPQPPLVDLWDRSLKPLLEQYLAGSDLRKQELQRLADAYHGR